MKNYNAIDLTLYNIASTPVVILTSKILLDIYCYILTELLEIKSYSYL